MGSLKLEIIMKRSSYLCSRFLHFHNQFITNGDKMSWRMVCGRSKLDVLLMRTLRSQSDSFRHIMNLPANERQRQINDLMGRLVVMCSKPPKGFEKFFKDPKESDNKSESPSNSD